MGRRVRAAIEPMIGLAGVFALWALISGHMNNANLLPSPAAVGRAFVQMLDDELPQDIAASLLHLAVGYGLGSLSGLLLALLAVRSPYIEAVVDPFVEFLRPIGAIAWIPIAILLFGAGCRGADLSHFLRVAFPDLRQHLRWHPAYRRESAQRGALRRRIPRGVSVHRQRLADGTS